MNHPAAYTRRSKHWSKYFNQTGEVELATVTRVAPTDMQIIVPYSLAVIRLDAAIDGQDRLEVMAADGERLAVGDKIKLVLRRIVNSDQEGVIDYRLKATKI